MQPLHLETFTAGADCAVLRIAGEVDVYSAPQLRERVIQLLADGIPHIIADLRGVDFLDSTGLGALVGSLKRLREQDGSLKLVTGAGRIPQLFRLTGLVRVFALHQSVPEAITGDRHWEAALTSESHSSEEWCRKHGLQ
jgi:anti-sigma B factor antagonist